MKNTTKIMLLAAVGTAALTVYLVRKANGTKSKKMLDNIADEGYETASDILFPGKELRNKLHYGPVIPG
jgi:hypothetical protein